MSTTHLFRSLCCAALLAGCQRAAVAPPAGGGHPLYPLRAGATWTYQAAGVGGEEVRRVTSAVMVGERLVARIETSAGYDVMPMWAVESPAGLALLPAYTADPPAELALQQAPVYLPPAAQWRPGLTWTYDGALPFAVGATPEPQSGGQAPRVKADYTVEGREAVSTPAGQFDAWRVKAAVTYAVGPNPTTRETLYFAPGVGLVRHLTQVPPAQTVEWRLVRTSGLSAAPDGP